jgi:3'-5' exoribonuclease
LKKLRPINTFIEGDKVQGFYLCVEKHLRYTRSGDRYIDLGLRDVTGHITAKIWDNVSVLNEKFDAGNAVAVSGIVETFLDRSQLIIKKINKATIQHYSRYGFDPARVVPSSKKNPKKMWSEIESLIDGIKNTSLKKLVKLIYRSNKKRLLVLPGSVKTHYSYRSGFIEHTLSTAQIAKKICSLYRVDRDLVLTGILLYGIGKINEINTEYEADYTTEGHLIGCSAMGRDIVRDAILKVRGFPDDFSKRIDHIILSCNLSNKLQSQEKPSFPEALLIKQIILLDARMNLMEVALDEDQETGKFTNRHNYFRVPLYKKDRIE